MSTLTTPKEEISSICHKDYTIHFLDWKTWQEPEESTPNFCRSLECPQCLTKLRPVQLISALSHTWWTVCPQCHAKYQRYIPYSTTPVEADPRDELLILMWSRIQQLEQRVQALERKGTVKVAPPREATQTRGTAQDSQIASETIDALPERYRSLLKTK